VARGEAFDVMSGRAFRQSVFCRADRRPELFSAAGLERLRVGPERIPFSEWEGDALAGCRSGALELHAARRAM